jgi:hypothetical protein
MQLLKGLSHEIDSKNFDKNLKNLASSYARISEGALAVRSNTNSEYGARIYRPSFHENKPKTLVFT